MDSERDQDFAAVVAGGYGVDVPADVDLVFVNIEPGEPFENAVRAGTLARLLSEGIDWDEAAAATGFVLEPRPGAGGTGRLRVEIAAGGAATLDLFSFADDPIGAVVRMVEESGGRLG